MFKRLIGGGGVRKSSTSGDLPKLEAQAGGGNPGDAEGKPTSPTHRAGLSAWSPWGGARPEDIVRDRSIEIRCKTLSRVDVREALERAGYDAGAPGEGDEPLGSDLLSLSTLPKVTERLSNNDASLPSVIANIEEHRERLVRETERRRGQGGADDSDGDAKSLSPREKAIRDLLIKSGSAGSDGDGRRRADGGSPSSAAVTPSAVVELFTHQADREAYGAEAMLQGVCEPQRSALDGLSRAAAVRETTLEHIEQDSAPSGGRAALGAPRLVSPGEGGDAGHRAALDMRKAGYGVGSHQDRILKLVFHVNLWDDGRHKDPFASEANSQRQRSYARRMKIKSLYLPQVVVNGSVSFAGSADETQTVGVLQHTLESRPLESERRAHILMQWHAGGESEAGGRRIKAIVSAGGGAAGAGAGNRQGGGINEPDVVLIVYDCRCGTVVGRGGAHNKRKGQAITETNVVRRFARLRTWTGRPMEVEFTLPAEHDGACLLLQEADHGPIVAASFIEVGRQRLERRPSNEY